VLPAKGLGNGVSGSRFSNTSGLRRSSHSSGYTTGPPGVGAMDFVSLAFASASVISRWSETMTPFTTSGG